MRELLHCEAPYILFGKNFFSFFLHFFAYNLFEILTCFQLMTPLVLNNCALFNVRLMNDLLLFFCHSECKAADQR